MIVSVFVDGWYEDSWSDPDGFKNKFLQTHAFNSHIENKKPDMILFCEETVFGFFTLMQSASSKKTSLLVLSSSTVFDESFSEKVFDDLVQDCDFMHNEDFKIMIMSKKFCSLVTEHFNSNEKIQELNRMKLEDLIDIFKDQIKIDTIQL